MLVIGAAIGIVATRSIVNANYFVGAKDDGTIVISHGVKQTVFGRKLNSQQEVVCIADAPADGARAAQGARRSPSRI
ncbi:hypothetical protein [Tsukamurella sp. PLM1]|uniref:hypothetical protein n=1 Tax=Tsukamurella sp. PLM1 TaxID=2929795 RepID=UPI00205F1D6E|nr:hypothetical protein MTP03_00390 [Tsukamurella sp. PLM1]